MTLWGVFKRYIEGMKKEDVIWYMDNYEALKNGSNEHNCHPEVETHEHIVKQAVEDPNQVNQDKGGGDRLCYYAWYTGGKDYPNSHMKVVIKRTFLGNLKIVTAYFLTSFGKSEKVIWTKN
jgi:hypothetical protein